MTRRSLWFCLGLIVGAGADLAVEHFAHHCLNIYDAWRPQ